VIPEAAVEAAAEAISSKPASEWGTEPEFYREHLRSFARAALEAAAPHLLADYRAQIELEYTKADERRHLFRAFHAERTPE
jgi:hypothetical protein